MTAYIPVFFLNCYKLLALLTTQMSEEEIAAAIKLDWEVGLQWGRTGTRGTVQEHGASHSLMNYAGGIVWRNCRTHDTGIANSL